MNKHSAYPASSLPRLSGGWRHSSVKMCFQMAGLHRQSASFYESRCSMWHLMSHYVLSDQLRLMYRQSCHLSHWPYQCQRQTGLTELSQIQIYLQLYKQRRNKAARQSWQFWPDYKVYNLPAHIALIPHWYNLRNYHNQESQQLLYNQIQAGMLSWIQTHHFDCPDLYIHFRNSENCR